MMKELDEQKISIYDFICRHYWEMSKEEMADMIREMDYAMYHRDKVWNGCVSYEEFHDEFLQNLYEQWEDDIAEEIKEEESGDSL